MFGVPRGCEPLSVRHLECSVATICGHAILVNGFQQTPSLVDVSTSSQEAFEEDEARQPLDVWMLRGPVTLGFIDLGSIERIPVRVE